MSRYQYNVSQISGEKKIDHAAVFIQYEAPNTVMSILARVQ